jgi:CubicO group peptidase (beta-lactamase class C family)
MAGLHRRTLLVGAAALTASSLPLSAQPTAAIGTAPPGQGPLSAADVGSLLAQLKVPGASLAIIQNGAIVATYGYGRAQPNLPVTPQTRFQAASISKTVNALTVLKLAEADEFRLDDPVNQRLRSWKLPDNALTAATPVTIRMLLNHTAGTTVSGFEGYLEGAPLPTLIQILNGTPPANSAPVRVEWPPGKTFHYSGGGTTVLQQMVMDVTQGQYPKVVHDLTLELLQMRDSNFDQPPPGSDFAKCAFGAGPDGVQLPGGFRVYPELAAAGLWTTPRDLALMVIGILQSHAGRPGSFLPATRAREMLTPAIDGAALGTFIDAKGMFWHNGGNTGYRSLYVGDPVSQNGMAAMTNGDNGEAVCTELRNRVAAAYAWR